MSLNQLMPGEYVQCDRVGLRNRVLTVEREVVVGENRSGAIVRRKRIWRVTYWTCWIDFADKLHFALMVADVPEYELKRVGSMDYEAGAA